MKILLATGGSIHSDHALRLGALLAPHADVPPTLLTVVAGPLRRGRGEQILAEAQDLLGELGVAVTPKLCVGHPEAEILAEAEAGGYDLVILGERRSHRLRTRIFGSVVMGVVAHVPCAVLVVKGEAAPIHRVLICDSGATQPTVLESLTRRRLLPLLSLNAAGQGAREGVRPAVTVLHVISQITAGPGVEAGALESDTAHQVLAHTPEGNRLAQSVALLQEMGVNAEAKVRHGLVVDEILAEAEAGGFGLTVIGAHRRAGWEHFLLEDIAHRVITEIRGPILVVR